MDIPKELPADVVIKNAARRVYERYPGGFYVSTLFDELFPGVPKYRHPDKSLGPLPLYNRLAEYVRVSKFFVKRSGYIYLRHYQPITANQEGRLRTPSNGPRGSYIKKPKADQRKQFKINVSSGGGECAAQPMAEPMPGEIIINPTPPKPPGWLKRALKWIINVW